MELSELAISICKHVARLRSARLVGLDLGNFYCNLLQPNKAVTFFTDLMRELRAENWNYLASQTLLELANCYRKMDDMDLYTKTCAAIACSSQLEHLVRCYYFDEFVKSINSIRSKLDIIDLEGRSHSDCITQLEDHFNVLDICVSNPMDGPIIQVRTFFFTFYFRHLLLFLNFSSIFLNFLQDDIITVQLKLMSNFPKEIRVNKIAISFEANSKHTEIIADDFLSR